MNGATGCYRMLGPRGVNKSTEMHTCEEMFVALIVVYVVYVHMRGVNKSAAGLPSRSCSISVVFVELIC
jgi:hypothetical protein